MLLLYQLLDVVQISTCLLCIALLTALCGRLHIDVYIELNKGLEAWCCNANCNPISQAWQEMMWFQQVGEGIFHPHEAASCWESTCHCIVLRSKFAPSPHWFQHSIDTAAAQASSTCSAYLRVQTRPTCSHNQSEKATFQVSHQSDSLPTEQCYPQDYIRYQKGEKLFRTEPLALTQ